MLEGIEDGTAAAMRLAGGAPLRRTLDVADPSHWLALDAGVREVARYRPQFLPEWEHCAPLPADLTQLGESRLALALCHHDGQIRQKAVRRSARYPDLLPLVMIRCADWAGPVRERARQLLREPSMWTPPTTSRRSSSASAAATEVPSASMCSSRSCAAQPTGGSVLSSPTPTASSGGSRTG